MEHLTLFYDKWSGIGSGSVYNGSGLDSANTLCQGSRRPQHTDNFLVPSSPARVGILEELLKYNLNGLGIPDCLVITNGT
jgi:hypothetical protein